MFNNANFGRVKTKIIDARTRRIVKESRWQKNLVFDSGLNNLANGIGFANFFQFCKTGSSNAAQQIASGAITFTQSGTTITASAAFFTSAMTGAILKYGTGTGGQEQYITFVNSTTATSATSFTQTSPIAGTVWMVQFTGLQSLLFETSTYQTTTGSNTTTVSGTQITLQRTFVFSQQSTTYTVNEIGYAAGASGATCNGRVVLTTGDTITNTQFYVVIWQLTFTVSPNAITAVPNVGTNINTAGNAMANFWDCQAVAANGTMVSYQGGIVGSNTGGNTMDGSGVTSYALFFNTAQPAQNSSISSAAFSAAGYTQAFDTGTLTVPSNTSNPVGVGTSALSWSGTTTGQSVTSLAIGSNTRGVSWSLILTTPFTAPNGIFSGNCTFTWTFTRTLTN